MARTIRRARFAAGLALAGLAMSVAPALAATLADLVGKRLTDVRLVSGTQPVDDASVLGLVETTVGEALSMADVRQTIDHLVALGRFADIQVFAEADGTTGVRLRYALVPVDRIVRVSFSGVSGLSTTQLRETVDERFGSQPMAARADEIAAAVTAAFRDHGYQDARASLTLAPTDRPGQVLARVAVVPGTRVVVGRTQVLGDPRNPADVLARLDLAPGRPLDPAGLETRTRDLEDHLRDEGFYEAVVASSTVPGAGGAIDVTVHVEMGAPVRVELTGDPLTAAERRTLVPVERLRSVSEEVVEDATRNIEQHFRLAGYRQAEARAERRRGQDALVVAIDVNRGPLHVLRQVDVDGLAEVPRSALEPLLKLTAGEPFIDARVAAVAAAIAELYHVRGYVDARVTPRITIGPAAGAGAGAPRVPVDLRFEVVEGRRVVVGAVRLDGAVAVGAEDLRSTLALTAGKPFYRPQQVLDREALERRYRNLGYQRAVIEARVEPRGEGVVDLAYVIREGAQTRVDHILVSGASRTAPDLIRREMTLQPGAPLGYDAIIESQQRLSGLGLFRRVRVSEAPHGADEVDRDVLVEVEEAAPTAITYGGGLEVGLFQRTSDAGTATDRFGVAPRGFFEVTRRNLWGKNRSISLLTSASLRPADPGSEAAEDEHGGYGLNQYRVVGTFREPRAFGTAGDAQLSAFVERGIRSSFNFDRRGVRSEYARRFSSNRVTVLGRYAYDNTKLYTKIATADQFLIDRLFPQVTLSTLFGSVLRDSRNDVLDPERGHVLGTDLEVAMPALGSEVGFTKGFFQAFTYRRLPGGRPFFLAGGARLGLAHGFATRVPRLDDSGQPVLDPSGAPVVDIVTDLPASERFFAGGDTTVRGFALDRLGSSDTLNADGFPTGGNALVVLNAELRTPLVKGVGLVTFVDAGNVFRRAGDLDLGELRAAAGFGFRYRSPVGPLRFDVGFKLDRADLTRGTERRVVYHLSIGQAF